MQYMRYMLDLDAEIKEPIQAHDAKGDVIVLEKLFERLLAKVMDKENLSHETAVEQLLDLSSRPVLIKYFPFGKHKNTSIEEVASSDPGYLKWLLAQKKENPDQEEDWIYTLEKYLK